jgi:hypothetical protein
MQLPFRLATNAAGEERSPIEPRWLSLAQVGDYMGGRTAEAVRMMLRRGQLPYVQDGKRILIDKRTSTPGWKRPSLRPLPGA